MSRKIRYIVVHCTATQPDTTIEAIKKYWKEQRGWGDTPGYHYLIEKNGNVENLLPENKNSNGVYGHNSETVNLSYVGGIDRNGRPIDTRTEEQRKSMFVLIMELKKRYPDARVMGHRDFAGVKKACPCFSVMHWLANCKPEKNIY